MARFRPLSPLIGLTALCVSAPAVACVKPAAALVLFHETLLRAVPANAAVMRMLPQFYLFTNSPKGQGI